MNVIIVGGGMAGGDVSSGDFVAKPRQGIGIID
ncbi:Uncharacterised protein [Providencia rustigianii]|nr:Uncharacterised protein [Providencia rustigianii]